MLCQVTTILHDKLWAISLWFRGMDILLYFLHISLCHGSNDVSSHPESHFSALLALCARNSPVADKFPSQRPMTQSLMFSLIWAWTDGWVNNCEAGDLRHHCAHYDVTVMAPRKSRVSRDIHKNCVPLSIMELVSRRFGVVLSHYDKSTSAVCPLMSMINCITPYLF